MSLHVTHAQIHSATAVATALLDPESLALNQASQSALFQFASRSFGSSVNQLGASGHEASLLQAFSSGYTSIASGHTESPLANQLLDAAYQHGGLAQSVSDLSDAITKLTTALGAKQQQDAAGGTDGQSGGQSWLEAIAKAMGEALGTMASKLVNESHQLSTLSGDSSPGGAQKFQSVMTQFQADSQLFGMLSDAFSNGIKSIGEGMKTMGSKT